MTLLVAMNRRFLREMQKSHRTQFKIVGTNVLQHSRKAANDGPRALRRVCSRSISIISGSRL